MAKIGALFGMPSELRGQMPSIVEDRLTLNVAILGEVFQDVEDDLGRTGSCRFV